MNDINNEGGKTVRPTKYIKCVREDLREIERVGQVIFQIPRGKFVISSEVYMENVTDDEISDLFYAVTTMGKALPEGWSVLDDWGRDANERIAAGA